MMALIINITDMSMCIDRTLCNVSGDNAGGQTVRMS